MHTEWICASIFGATCTENAPHQGTNCGNVEVFDDDDPVWDEPVDGELDE